jgi:hypothetical protein
MTRPGRSPAKKERRCDCDVEPGDADAYLRLRCDPVMTAELGGPVPHEGIDDKAPRMSRRLWQAPNGSR